MNTSTPRKKVKNGNRKPIVNPTEQRKGFLQLAEQLRSGQPLLQAQMDYLAPRFQRIGEGESADLVFHLKRQPGQKIEDEERRKKMRLVFSLIATLKASPHERLNGENLPLHIALEKGSELARTLFGESDPDSYSPEYLNKLWHDPSYEHMKSTFVDYRDPDSPFPFEPKST